MNSFLLFDFITKLVYVLVALGIMTLVLRAFDRLTDVNFKESFKGVQNDPKAFAIYIGLRFTAISILISSII